MKLRFQSFYVGLLIVVCAFSGCVGGRRTPNLEAIFAQTKMRRGKRPVIIIPGVLGSELVNAKTQERVWLSLSASNDDDLSLPISPDLTKNRDNLVAKGIIQKAKISAFLPEVYVYQALIDSMQKYGGYTEGNWENPDIANGGLDKYYIFAYDWRLDNVENARLLTRKIHELKEKLAQPELRFNVIAHSMGGLIARYAAMYGDADLPENDQTPVPNRDGAKDFNKIFMFGTPNEGSMASLETLIKGFRIGGFLLDNLKSEAVFTSPAVFQLLPHRTTERFYDENLAPLDVDLYDLQTWKKFGWSAYSSKSFLDKFTGDKTADTKNNPFAGVSRDELDAYFTNVLRRAKNFHRALDTDSAIPPSISFYAFGSDCDDTQDGAILIKTGKNETWQTIFTPKNIQTFSGKNISAAAMSAKLFAPGDSRVTRRSLLAETLNARPKDNTNLIRNLPVSATLFCENHNDLPNNKIMQDNFLTALINEVVK